MLNCQCKQVLEYSNQYSAYRGYSYKEGSKIEAVICTYIFKDNKHEPYYVQAFWHTHYFLVQQICKTVKALHNFWLSYLRPC